MNAGYLESRANESGNDYAFGRVQSVASGNGWGFSGTFRRANILLANIDKSECRKGPLACSRVFFPFILVHGAYQSFWGGALG